MAVRIYIEIGHEASIRTKKTQEGFTHDWEVFVRGCDGAEIHYYIDKVVFYLHETFPKPKRVIKEPPYVVKESGYAGFNLPIDIYLRNNGEPKKIRFNYDLHLQQSGPPIIKVQKEKYIFNNISDEFRTKLLKGGGMIVNSSNITENLDNRSNFDDKQQQQMINKPKLAINSSDIIKKPKLKITDSYNNDNFQELFGSPIITTSKTVDTKPQPSWKDTKSLSKSDKEKWRTKHSPHKDRDKDRDKSKDKNDSERKSNRDDKKNKEKLKERERCSKDKERNLKKEQRTPSPKRNNSPKRSPTRLTSPLIIKHKDSGGGGSSSSNNNSKHDKDNNNKRGDKLNDDRKLKKEKRNKEHKENKQIIDDSSCSNNNNRLDEQRDKIKLEKDLKKDSLKIIKNENPTSPQLQKPAKKEKSKEKKNKDQSKEKYKSKKKDKERKDDKEKRSYGKNDKKSDLKQKSETTPSQQQQQAPPPLPLTPNKTTMKKSNFLIDEDSSSSSTSSTTSIVTTSTTTTTATSTIATTTIATAAEKKTRHENNKNKDEKSFKTNKKDRNSQDNQSKYNKRKSNSPEREEPPEKQQKDNNINNNLDEHKEIERNFKTTINQEEEDYLNLLRELQHKIMGLKDNNDLTKVVQLIAETGRYEVSAHTFDFDLCLLDRSTVQQLQNFFANEY